MEDDNPLTASAEAEGRRLLMTAFETAPAGNFAARADLAGRLRRASRRSRRARALVPAGAAAALAGVTVAGLALTASVASAPSAMATVTTAAAKTSAESFRFTTVITAKGTGGTRALVTGVFDPAHGIGEEHTALNPPGGGWFKIRLVGGRMYVSRPGFPFSFAHGKPWVEGRIASLPAGRARLRAIQITIGPRSGSPDPAQLLGELKSVVSVTSEGQASGPGWTGTRYGFTVRPPREARGTGGTLHGTVWVDGQGRVRRMLEIRTLGKITITREVSFSGFGMPVSVTPPPAGEVYNLGDTPLGFGL